MKRIAVIGSGVIGLTVAYRLLDAGFAVTILAEALPPSTTSDVAAAFWAPSATMGDRLSRGWALASLARFRELTANGESGIALVDLYQLAREVTGLPHLPYEGAAVTAVPMGHFPSPWSGYSVRVPRIDVPVYMPWLVEQVVEKGALIEQQHLQHFGELGNEYALIVNCSGLGAAMLTDDELYPIRGQVISVRRPVGMADDIIYADDHESTTYIIPRSQDCLLGGTYQYRDGNTDVDEAIAAQILARCARFNPAVAEAEILQHKVGLRPGRNGVRLETERQHNGQLVIHNYGHGSIGHTLSWGCAAAVLQRVEAALGSNGRAET